jgi:hypothetical protein
MDEPDYVRLCEAKRLLMEAAHGTESERLRRLQEVWGLLREIVEGGDERPRCRPSLPPAIT